MTGMDILLVILGFLALLAGFVGSIVPAVPGPPLSFVGLLLLQWSGRAGFTPTFLWVWAAVAVAVTVMDNLLPAWMTKRFGGSRMAVWGSVLGLVIGMIFFAPLGLLLGPFLGALAGESFHNYLQDKRNRANGVDLGAVDNGARAIKTLKVALGAFLAFIVGTGAKLISCLLMIVQAIRAIFA